MPEKMPNTVNIIKKLTELLPKLSETEAEAARYQIEQLKNKNPFLAGKDRNPQTVLECWEARDTSRVRVIKERIDQEKNLLEGYKVILRENTTNLLLERVDKAQRIIYFLDKELSTIKRFLSDAFSNKNGTASLLLDSEDKKPENISRYSGSTHLSIVGIVSKNPLHRNTSIKIYTDDIFIGKIDSKQIEESKSISIEFSEIHRLEFMIITEEDVVAGLIYFPIQDLVDVEDLGVKSFFYNISDDSTLSISFGKCMLNSPGISRSSLHSIMTKKSAEHLLRKLESISLCRCGVCGNANSKSNQDEFYRCDWCKFTCHTHCTYLIFFECAEYKKRKEAEAQKKELEKKLDEMKRDRLNIIIAAIDIREKAREIEESADRIQNSHIKAHNTDSASESDEEAAPAPTKRYSVEHALTKEKMLGASWCCHCGEKIGILAIALWCSTCSNTYHTSCRNMIFKSCGITGELLEGLTTYIPKHHKKRTTEISVSEFEFISLLCSEGLGKAYLCTWRDKTVALKALKKKDILEQSTEDLIYSERSCLEIATASKNPFLVNMYGCFQNSTHIFFILEFLQGGDLYFHLHTREISEPEIKMILAGIVIGLEWLHSENIIYRDLRLENVMFAENGYIKLINFGLCSLGANNGVAHTLCGSISNIAPELIDEHYTKAVDWWALGVVAYQLMLKSVPFMGSSIKQVKDAIQNDPPENLELIAEPARSFISGLLQKDMENRLGTASIHDIKNHEYFAEMDWDKMKAQELPVHWKPDPANKCINFDPAMTEKDCHLSPAEEADKLMNSHFQDF